MNRLKVKVPAKCVCDCVYVCVCVTVFMCVCVSGAVVACLFLTSLSVQFVLVLGGCGFVSYV